jgi:5-methylcytosine-specific restriction endonuclease McrA
MLKLCNGCGNTFPPQQLKRGRCPSCERKRNRERTLYEPNHRAYSSARWQKLRQVVRARDRGRCRYESSECRGRLEVHHIVPAKAHSELFFALDNLELVCRRHHEQRERAVRADSSGGDGGPLATGDNR